MRLEKNNDYCATVVAIKTKVQLPKCDNVVAAMIFGNSVIVGKDTPEGEVGLFFPVETQLSHEFLSKNNLYRHQELNADQEKKGYFEDSRRIRAVKFRGYPSEGFFIPIESLTNLGLKTLPEIDFDLLLCLLAYSGSICILLLCNSNALKHLDL